MLKCILTDIEGTTSSISFVKDVLFPYSYDSIPAYVEKHKSEPEIKVLLDAAAEAAGVAKDRVDLIVQQLLNWIREDRKVTALKTLQGYVWAEGYRNGDYKAHIYADAYEALQHWHKLGIPIYVYSSGSVQAQKLFFSYSEFGDISDLFSGYFDTNIGPKNQASSYAAIAEQIRFDPESILFLSDMAAELQAAHSAAMTICWLVRPGDTTASIADISKSAYPTATSFYEVSTD